MKNCLILLLMIICESDVILKATRQPNLANAAHLTDPRTPSVADDVGGTLAALSDTSTDVDGCIDNSTNCAANAFQCHNMTYVQENCQKTCNLCSGCSSSNEFECSNGHCIPNNWLCDGDDDCGDRADEDNCSDGCKYGAFQCPNGECIRNSLLCDGRDDCGDRADETCPDGCKSYQFQCPNGWCIPEAWLCDGVDNCGDRSDESFPDESFSNTTCYKYDHVQKKCVEDHRRRWPICFDPPHKFSIFIVPCNACHVHSRIKEECIRTIFCGRAPSPYRP